MARTRLRDIVIFDAFLNDCHFSSGVRSARGFLLMLPPVGGPEWYRFRQSNLSGEQLHVRYRAVPRTNRTPSTANTPGRFAASSTNALPACGPSRPWQCSDADASPSASRPAPAR